MGAVVYEDQVQVVGNVINRAARKESARRVQIRAQYPVGMADLYLLGDLSVDKKL